MKKLDAIRGREKAATEGPWELEQDCYFDLIRTTADVDECDLTMGDYIVHGEEGHGGYYDKMAKRNAEFIAHSRQDVKWLLDVAEKFKPVVHQYCENCDREYPSPHCRTCKVEIIKELLEVEE